MICHMLPYKSLSYLWLDKKWGDSPGGIHRGDFPEGIHQGGIWLWLIQKSIAIHYCQIIILARFPIKTFTLIKDKEQWTLQRHRLKERI